MIDFEEKNNNSEINEVNESDDTSQNKIEIAELQNNIEQNVTYGAVYYPQKDGKAYTCNQYSTNKDVGTPTSPENIDNAHRSSEKKKKRSRIRSQKFRSSTKRTKTRLQTSFPARTSSIRKFSFCTPRFRI